MLRIKPVILLLLLVKIQSGVASDLLNIYQDAVAGAPQLEQAREALAAVGENYIQAKASLYLPEAAVSTNVYGNSQSVQLSQDSTGINGRSNFISAGYSLILTQPLIHYDRVVGLEQSDSRVGQAHAEYAATEIALILLLAERYFDVLAATENLEFAQLQQASLARGLQETKQHEAAGYLAKTDVEEAQAGFDRAVTETLEAENVLKDAHAALQELTGKRYTQLAHLGKEIPLIKPIPDKETAWVEQARKQNLTLQAIEYSVSAAKNEIQRQEAGHLPTLDAVGNHSFSSAGGRFGSADIQDTSLGLNLTVPLYQGGRVNSKIREAEHRYREVLAKQSAEQRAVERTVSKAFHGVMLGISRIEALAQNLRSSQTAVAATESGFRVGRRTALDVIVAEREQLRAQRDYARARYDFLLNTLRLKHAVGTLSPSDLVQINRWLES